MFQGGFRIEMRLDYSDLYEECREFPRGGISEKFGPLYISCKRVHTAKFVSIVTLTPTQLAICELEIIGGDLSFCCKTTNIYKSGYRKVFRMFETSYTHVLLCPKLMS